MNRRLFIEWLLIGLVTSLVIMLTVRSGLFQQLDDVIYDTVAPLHAPPPDDRILIIDIDNDSLSALGRWPWRRTVHAAAIEQMQTAGAKAIVYDVLFSEPTADDAALARAIQPRPPLFLPLLMETPGPNGRPYAIFRPTNSIAKAAAGLGSANILFDLDGRTRWVEVATPTTDGAPIPHVMELAYRVIVGHPSPAFQRVNESGEPLLLPINGRGAFRTISFAALTRGEVPAAFLRDKILLVGASAPGLGDTHPVSSARGGSIPGIELQANLLNNLLADRFIARAPDTLILLASMLPLWLLLAAFWRLRPESNLLLAFGLLAMLLAGTVLLLAGFGIWVPPSAAIAGVVFVYPLWGWRRLATLSHFLVTEVDRLKSNSNLADLPEPDWRSGDRIAAEAERLHTLLAMIRQAAQEREVMLQFLSHDMRAPQAAIIALTEKSASTDQGRRLLDQVRNHARHGLRLADDFVRLARLQSRPLERLPVDICDALAQASDLVWPIAQTKAVTITRDVPAGEVWVDGDDSALVRAFTNLLDNAVRFSPPGSRVRCSIERTNDAVLCTIADSGPGLPPDRIAAPFARFGYSERKGPDGSAHKGVGLGLAYVAQVAEQLGGDVRYSRAPTGGACFTLSLPLSQASDIPHAG